MTREDIIKVQKAITTLRIPSKSSKYSYAVLGLQKSKTELKKHKFGIYNKTTASSPLERSRFTARAVKFKLLDNTRALLHRLSGVTHRLSGELLQTSQTCPASTSLERSISLLERCRL